MRENIARLCGTRFRVAERIVVGVNEVEQIGGRVGGQNAEEAGSKYWGIAVMPGKRGKPRKPRNKGRYTSITISMQIRSRITANPFVTILRAVEQGVAGRSLTAPARLPPSHQALRSFSLSLRRRRPRARERLGKGRRERTGGAIQTLNRT